MLLLRRTPLSGLLGSVRLGAECLWSFGARGALDGIRRDLDAFWADALGNPLLSAPVTYKTSQIHLCADIANWAPAPDALSRVVTRSLKKAVYLPSPGDAAAALWGGEGERDDLADLADGALLADAWLAGEEVFADVGEIAPPEWFGVPLDLLPNHMAGALFDGSDDDDEGESNEGAAPLVSLDTAQETLDAETDWAEDGEASVYLWGRRASGFAFSPGADLSAVWYDKLLEERRSGKRWMEAFHTQGGWIETMPLTRVEVRFRRGALRDLTSARVSPLAPAEAAPRWFDDPWECLEHFNDLWGHAVGVPAEADLAPDVTYRGWLWLLTPVGTDHNRARWRVDPVWEVIQRVSFSDADAQPLKKVPVIKHDLRQVDAELYGLLKLRAALRGQQLGTDSTLSLELADFARSADDLDATLGRDFAEEVREKARKLGRAVPRRQRVADHADTAGKEEEGE